MRWTAVMMLLLAGCSGEMQSAQRLISDIDRSVRAAAPEAAQYVPEQLSDVRVKLAALKEAFELHYYAAVVNDAPAVMRAAQALSGAAAAKRHAMLKTLNQEWSVLAAAVPEDLAAIEKRIDLLGKNAAKKPPEADLDAARASLSHGVSLWSKAQATLATGNIDEAVSVAKTLELQLVGLAGDLKLELSESTATQPESAAIRGPAFRQ